MSPQSVLERLIALGCRYSLDGLGRLYVSFCRSRIRKDRLPEFARTVSRAARFARTGILVADKDRNGRLVGWHQNERNRM